MCECAMGGYVVHSRRPPGDSVSRSALFGIVSCVIGKCCLGMVDVHRTFVGFAMLLWRNNDVTGC